MTRLWQAVRNGVGAFRSTMRRADRQPDARTSQPETPLHGPYEAIRPFGRLASDTAERQVGAMLGSSPVERTTKAAVASGLDAGAMLADVLERAGPSTGMSGHTFGVTLDLIIGICASKRRSGRLWIRTSSELLTLDLRFGTIVRAGADGQDCDGERIGEMLVGMGVVDPATVTECLGVSASSQSPIGAVLIERGHVTIHELRDALHQQAILRLSRALFCQGAAYAFTHSPGDADQPTEDLGLDAAELVGMCRVTAGDESAALTRSADRP